MIGCPSAAPGCPTCRHTLGCIERVVITLSVCLVAACDPAYSIHLAALPARRPQDDSLSRGGLAMVAHVATRHRLSRIAPPEEDTYQWTDCFAERGITLCAKADSNQMEVYLWQFRAFRKFGATAEGLRRELVDSLVVRFGSGAIRECDIKYEETPGSNWWRRSYRAICVPRAVSHRSL